MPSYRTMSQLSLEEQIEAQRLYSKTSRTGRDIAEAFGIKVSSLTNFMADRGVPKLDSEFSLPKSVDNDVLIEKARAESRVWHEKYQTMVRREALAQRLVSAMQDSVQAITPLPLLPIVSSASTDHDQLAVALLSDLHIGEVVDPEETGGLAQYNMQIFNRRLALWTHKVIDLVTFRRSFVHVPELLIAGLGDWVSGSIHDELARTNEGHETSILSRGAYLVAQSFALLSPHFENIHFHGVVGNHGRMTKRPEAKERWNNWDYLMYQLVALFCRDIENIHFHIPKSFYTVVDANGLRLLLIHGDNIKSYMSIPFYGINRAISNFHDILQNTEHQFDGVLMGHFHSAADIDKFAGPVLISSSFKGGDEFCFLGDQNVTMFDGTVKPISEVVVGDYVLSGEGNIKRVTNAFHYDVVDRDIVSVCSRDKSRTLVGTANHHIPVTERVQHSSVKLDYSLEQAEVQLGDIEVKGKKGCRVFNRYFLHSPMRKLDNGGSFQDGFLVGLYLAEGSMNQGDQVVFSLHERELVGGGPYVNAWYGDKPVENRGGGYRRYVHVKHDPLRHAGTVWFAHSGLRELLAKWTNMGNSHTKKLVDLPIEREFAKGVLFGWLGGDGTVDMAKAMSTSAAIHDAVGVTVSDDLAYQMLQLATDLGYSSGLSKSYGGYNEESEMWHVSVNTPKETGSGRKNLNDYMASPVRGVAHSKFTGSVYDLEIEDDHSYVVEGYAVHNSVGKLFVANRPSQTLAYFHPVHGRIGTEYIYLSDADDQEIDLDDPVPDVWANVVLSGGGDATR